MREIKFRVWDGKQFHYTPDFNLHFFESGITVGLNNGGMVFHDGSNIQEFTNLHDKNDKEIYEGDIVSAPVVIESCGGCTEFWYDCPVEWDKRNLTWVLLFKKYKNQRFPHRQKIVKFQSDKYYSVIGNIYENPELIK